MSKKYSLVLACLLLAAITRLSAQNFEVPKNYSLKYTVDYATYEPDLLKCIDWLENSPLDQDKDKHAQAFKFLMDWVDGAPNVHVLILGDLVYKNKKNFALLAVYMGEWSRYELKHGDKADPTAAALSAIRAEIKVYKKGNGLVKDKTIDKLIDLDEKGQLDKYVAAEIAKLDKAAKTVTKAGH